MFAMTSAYKLLQNEKFRTIQILLKPLIDSLVWVLINRI